jgi:tRNA(fMet)-specific endonuclease VapC
VILLDTDVVSFIMKGDDRGEAYFEQVKGRALCISFMSAAELFAWAELRHWGERRRAELDWLLSNRYAVLGFELGLAREWARIQAEGAAAGRPITVQDGWVAATARYHDLVLAAHNRKHFEGVPGIHLLPPPQSFGQG